MTIALMAVAIVAAVRLTTAGPTLHDWEPPVWLGATALIALGAAMAVRWEGFGATVLAFTGVVGGVSLAAHYGPVMGLVPVITLIPPAVLLILAWQRVRSVASVAAFAVSLVAVLAAGGFAAFAAYDTVYGPSHPSSDTPAAPPSPVEWMWAGAADTSGFTVVAGIDDAGPVRLLISTSPDGPWDLAATGTAAGDPVVVRLRVDGLASGADYAYVVETDAGRGPIATAATFPDGPSDLTIAFSSCARLGSNGSVFDTIRESDPDLYIVTGDLFYGDIGPNDPEAFEAAYVDTLVRPAQAALYRSAPIAYVWDDHDYSQNDADASAVSRPAAMGVYRELVPHYPLRGDDAPIAQAFTMGRVRIIMTDTRSARSGDGATALGEEQLAWFEAELRDAAGQYPLVVWVNPDPWIAEADPGADHWGGYAAERRELAELIDTLDFEGFLMLSGDAHMIAIDDGSNNTYADGDPGFPVFHAGALDRPGSLKGGPYSEGAVARGGQFGIVEVHDDGDTMTVELSGRDWTGEVLLSYEFTVGGEVG